jgi:predicted dehydrogenase
MTRVAIIGFGWWGKNIADLVLTSAKMKLAAIVEPTAGAADEYGHNHGIAIMSWEQALASDDVDAVILTSPHRFHESQIIQAAEAGKHVFCEKPLAFTLESAARAMAVCIRQGVVLGIGHEKRFEPSMVLIRRVLSKGELGELLHIESNWSHDKFLALPPGNWRVAKSEAAVGPITATGIHLLDMAVSLGGEASQVYATNRSLATAFESGDTAISHVTFPSGVAAVVNAMLATPFYSRYTVFGTKGWIEVRDKTHVEAPTGWTVSRAGPDGRVETMDIEPMNPVIVNLERFAAAAAAASQESYDVPLQEMLNTVAAFEALTRSAQSGRTESVPYVRVADL